MKAEDGFATTLVPVDKIRPPLFQCRTETLDTDLDELVDSIKELGLLEPLVIRIDKDAQPELVVGSRRLKACQKAGLTMVPVVIRDLTDEQALEIEGSENLNRNDLSSEEKTRLVSEWAKRGYKATEIPGKVHKSYSWVVTFLPSEFKDKKMAKLGALGGDSKAAATNIVADQSKPYSFIEDMEGEKPHQPQLAECERCHVVNGSAKDWEGHKLCPIHYAKALEEPAQMKRYFQVLEDARKKHPPEERPTTPFSVTKWEDKVGNMQVQHSKKELRFVELCEKEDALSPIVTDRAFPLLTTTPDAFFPRHNAVAYVDDPETHGPKQMDRDDELRGMFKKRFPGWKVFVFREGKPEDWVKQVKEAV